MYRVSRQSARNQREAGAAMVEMVFVLVPLLALIFLLVDTAWVIFARASLQEAVRQAVRFGVVGQLAPGCSGMPLFSR
jgi:Flp pilus assembly protein TadG